jgi:hypothetical protein
MDHVDPVWVWHGTGLVGLAAAGAFALLQRRVGRPTETAAQATEATVRAWRGEEPA